MFIKDVTTRMFYRMFFVVVFFIFLAGSGGRERSIMSGLPHQFNDFSADTKQSQINYKSS